MNVHDADLLFSAITAHLSGARGQSSAPETDYNFWDGRTRISAAEMAILMALTTGPLGAEALAGSLGRDLPCIQELLEALVAKGIVDRRGERYAVTMATGLYCQAMSTEWRSRDGDHRRQ